MIPVTVGELRALAAGEFAKVVVVTDDGYEYEVHAVEVVGGGTEVHLRCPDIQLPEPD